MKSVDIFDRISIPVDVTFVWMISHFPLFLPTLRDLVANVLHRLWHCMVELRPTGMSKIYYKYRNGPKTYPWNTLDSRGTLILSPSIITLHPISCFFLLMKKQRMANLIICLRNRPLLRCMSIYHLLLGAVVSYGSWIYNYLCNQCLSFHHLRCEFEFWFSLDTPVSATNKIDLHDITEMLLKVAFNTITLILTIFSFLRLLR